MPQPEYADVTQGLWGPPIKPRIHSEQDEPDELPDESELRAGLGEIAELLGSERCATAYQLSSPDDLPEVWEGQLMDQRALLRRLLRHAGEDDRSFPVRVIDGRHARAEEFADHLAGDLAYVELTTLDDASDELVAHFLVSALGDLRAMFGPSCVELGRAVVHRARVEARGRGYREDEGHSKVDLPSELDGFLAAYALGWGVPVTNACLDPRSTGSMRGDWVGTAWVGASLSYPPETAARLLAVIYRAGARGDAQLDACRAALNPSQRALFDVAYAELAGEEAALRSELRWAEPQTWPPPAERVLDELEYDADDEALETAEQAFHARVQQPNLGAIVFRARPPRSVQGAALGGLLGLVVGLAGLGPFAVIPGVALGALLGSRLRGSQCSGPRCGAPLALDAETCPGCGGTIVGEITRTKDHLGALEDYELAMLGPGPSSAEDE